MKVLGTYTPLGSMSAQDVMNSPRWWEPRMDESLEDGGWRMEDGGWRMEDGGWRGILVGLVQ